jgi:ribose transport system substrate-binding protein
VEVRRKQGDEDRSIQDGRSNHSATKPDYVIQSVARACALLQCFPKRGRTRSLNELTELTRLSKPTVFRLLFTLVQSGMLERTDKNTYQLSASNSPSQFRLGYASQSEEFSFSRMVSDSIRSSCYEAGLDLLVLSNQYSPRIAVRNAEIFVREHVDLVIEFQTDQQSASIVASKLVEAGIPMIAIEIPHPGAYYYGADNYRAGLIGGRALAHACLQQWKGEVDEIVLLELAAAGPLVRTRLMGMLAGIRELMPKCSDRKVRFLNGNGRYENSLDIVRKYLRRTKAARVLVGGINDPSCIGALRAFEEAGRAEQCLAVGHNASIEAREEIRRPGSRLIGSVGYFPEQYGDAVVRMAMNILRCDEAPQAAFVKHQIVTLDNVDSIYPNDQFIVSGEADSLLFSRR